MPKSIVKETGKARGNNLVVEPLKREHKRKLFDCGDAEITRFLQEKPDKSRNVTSAGQWFEVAMLLSVSRFPEDEKRIVKALLEGMILKYDLTPGKCLSVKVER